MKSQTTISTLQADRIAKRLIQHWRHKFEVDVQPAQQLIFMPNAIVTLRPEQQQLWVQIESPADDLTKMQQVVLDHLSRMGNEALVAQWH